MEQASCREYTRNPQHTHTHTHTHTPKRLFSPPSWKGRSRRFAIAQAGRARQSSLAALCAGTAYSTVAPPSISSPSPGHTAPQASTSGSHGPRAVRQWAWRCLQSVLLLAWPQQCQRRADGAPHSSSLRACPNRTGLLALRAPLGSRENRWEAF